MGYLSELIYGNYDSNSEDRLSQIFSASFNHSPSFKRAILRFLGVSYRAGYTSDTQLSYDVKGRTFKIDISLQYKQTTHIIIENKVDSILTARQLRNYNIIPELRNVKKICIVRKVEPGEKYPGNWTILHWHDVHSCLRTECPDDFFAQNVMEILEEHNMMVPEKITRSELQALARALYTLRYKKRPILSLDQPVFETIIKYKAMLGEIWSMARKDELIRKRVARNFRCNPMIGNLYDEDTKRGDRRSLWLGWMIALARKRKQIKRISTGISFSEKEQWCRISTDVLDRTNSILGNDIEYRKKDLIFADYSKQVISFWRRRLR